MRLRSLLLSGLLASSACTPAAFGDTLLGTTYYVTLTSSQGEAGGTGGFDGGTGYTTRYGSLITGEDFTVDGLHFTPADFGSDGGIYYNEFDDPGVMFTIVGSQVLAVENTPYGLLSSYATLTLNERLGTGTYTLEQFDAFNGQNFGDAGTFTYALASSPVPEPSSLALLGTDFIGIVAAARRRLS